MSDFDKAYDLAYDACILNEDMLEADLEKEEDLFRVAVPLCNKIGTLIKKGNMSEEQIQHIIRILGGCSGED